MNQYAGLAVSGMLLAFGLLPPLRATSLQLNLNPFTGSDVDVLVKITDEDPLYPDKLKIEAEVVPLPDGTIGDLIGLWIEFDNGLPAALTESMIAGVWVTKVAFNTNDLGNGNNMNSALLPLAGTFDVGISLGQSGLKGGADDIRYALITIDNASLSLAPSDLAALGARVQSVGLPGGDRGGSSKLYGEYGEDYTPDDTGSVPEPGTYALLGLGLIVMGLWRRKRR